MRLILQIAIFILFGVLLNVGMAWVSAIFLDVTCHRCVSFEGFVHESPFTCLITGRWNCISADRTSLVVFFPMEPRDAKRATNTWDLEPTTHFWDVNEIFPNGTVATLQTAVRRTNDFSNF